MHDPIAENGGERSDRYRLGMAITGWDHGYFESHGWDASVVLWEGLGLRFAGRWGSEGHRSRFLGAGKAAVVLAETDPDTVPASNAFFSLDGPDAYAIGEAVKVVTPLEPTHWDTRWIRVEDPEGRFHCLEAHSEE